MGKSLDRGGKKIRKKDLPAGRNNRSIKRKKGDETNQGKKETQGLVGREKKDEKLSVKRRIKKGR